MKTISKFGRLNERMIGGTDAENYAKQLGIDVKTKSGETQSELVSGGSIESKLVDIVKDLELMTGFQFKVTGGNDKFHQELSGNSRHASGMAIDIVFDQANDSNARKKVEDAILTLMLSGKYNTDGNRIGAINEYDNPSKHATGGHFHISLGEDNSSRDGWECILPLNGITNYSQVRKVANTGKRVWEGGVSLPSETQRTVQPIQKQVKIKKKFKFFSQEHKKTLIAIRKDQDTFKVKSKQGKQYGTITRSGSNIYWEIDGVKKDISNESVGNTFRKLFEKPFSSETYTKSSVVITNTIENDQKFYEEILNQLGAKVTDEKMKFFYAWRKAEGGRARNNPFNTTFNLTADRAKTDYNSAGVKNYSTSEYGIEATVKTLNLDYYKDIVNMLKNDNITANELASSPALETWGTGGLVAKVLASNTITPPPIYA